MIDDAASIDSASIYCETILTDRGTTVIVVVVVVVIDYTWDIRRYRHILFG